MAGSLRPMKKPGQFAYLGAMVINAKASETYARRSPEFYRAAAAKRKATDRAAGRRVGWSSGPLKYNEGVFHGVRETAWERQLARLGLVGQDWPELAKSEALRRWAKKHCQRHYVPEELLTAWGLTIQDYGFSSIKEWNKRDQEAGA
jgi:hypothetical protein